MGLPQSIEILSVLMEMLPVGLGSDRIHEFIRTRSPAVFSDLIMRQFHGRTTGSVRH